MKSQKGVLSPDCPCFVREHGTKPDKAEQRKSGRRPYILGFLCWCLFPLAAWNGLITQGPAFAPLRQHLSYGGVSASSPATNFFEVTFVPVWACTPALQLFPPVKSADFVGTEAGAESQRHQFTGTRCFNSSNQFCTTTNSETRRSCSSTRTIKKRRPSRDTS